MKKMSLDNDIGSINGFSIESIIADKSRVLFSKKRFRRVKDLYDLYMLINATGVIGSIDLNKVRDIIKRASLVNGENSSELLPADMFPFTSERLEDLNHAWDKFKIISTSKEVEKPKLSTVVAHVAKFLDALLYPDEISGDYRTEWKI